MSNKPLIFQICKKNNITITIYLTVKVLALILNWLLTSLPLIDEKCRLSKTTSFHSVVSLSNWSKWRRPYCAKLLNPFLLNPSFCISNPNLNLNLNLIYQVKNLSRVYRNKALIHRWIRVKSSTFQINRHFRPINNPQVRFSQLQSLPP